MVSFDESLIVEPDATDLGVIDFANDHADDGDTSADLGVDVVCTEEPRCDDSQQLVRCEDVISTCPLGCEEEPSARCLSFVPTNSVPTPGSADESTLAPLLVDKSTVLDACTGQIYEAVPPNAIFSTVDQQQGPTIGVLQVHSLSISEGATLTLIGTCALAIVAYRWIDIEGTIDAGGGRVSPWVAGPGGTQGAYTNAAQGCGAGTDGEDASLGGGGGGAFSTSGGAGPGGGAGGAPCDLAALSPLVGGSGGGHGGCSTAGTCAGGHGGGGGGAVALVAGEYVRVGSTGGIIVAGGGGEGGLANSSGGGGGGSGGALLFEAPAVIFIPSALINAGGGGGGGVSNDSASAARGSRGTTTLEPAAGGEGVTTGGNGSVGRANGLGGGEGNASGSGGGGGGGGFIRINAAGEVTLPMSFNGESSIGELTLP